jgi:hypothetical protein
MSNKALHSIQLLLKVLIKRAKYKTVFFWQSHKLPKAHEAFLLRKKNKSLKNLFCQAILKQGEKSCRNFSTVFAFNFN